MLDRLKYGMAACALLLAALAPAPADAQTTIDVRFRFNPTPQDGAPPGGAHPVGGLSQEFVNVANSLSAITGVNFLRITPNGTNGFATLHASVAAGPANGGDAAGIDIPINNGHQFGELFVAGLPFGFTPEEYMTYLYEGGGLELQQGLYDQVFGGQIVVIPVGITTAQGAGWFPEELPDPGNPANGNGKPLTQFDKPVRNDLKAMKELCEMPIIVRWAEPGGGSWRKACEMVGAPAALLGGALTQSTRCADAFSPCGTATNPVTLEVTGLTFGGFTPGILPQLMLNTGNIDSHEFNLPTADIQFNRLAIAQQRGVPVAQVTNDDISEVVAKAPFQYGGSWHQPLSYIELLINRQVWDALSDEEREGIKVAARSGVLRNLTARLNLQGDAMKVLAKAGAKLRTWPDGLLRVLRVSNDVFLDEKADSLADPNNPDYDEGRYRQVVDHQRAYIKNQISYWDFGDINQGLNRTPTSGGKGKNK